MSLQGTLNAVQLICGFMKRLLQLLGPQQVKKRKGFTAFGVSQPKRIKCPDDSHVYSLCRHAYTNMENPAVISRVVLLHPRPFGLVERARRACNNFENALGEVPACADQGCIARSARVGDEIGGHNVSGHIYTTGEITQITRTDDNRRIAIKVNSSSMQDCHHHMLQMWPRQEAQHLCLRKMRLGLPGEGLILEVFMQSAELLSWPFAV